MITIPELVAQALGSFLTSETKGRFGSSHARLAEFLPYAARLTLECIGNSDALYHNIEHTMLVTLAGHDILMGRAMLRPTTPDDYANFIVNDNILASPSDFSTYCITAPVDGLPLLRLTEPRFTGAPWVLKGIMDEEDARLAVESGADAMIVSNHGGRQLDGVAATLRARTEPERSAYEPTGTDALSPR